MLIDRKIRNRVKERINILICQLLELGETRGDCIIDEWQCRLLKGIPLWLMIKIGVLYMPSEVTEGFREYISSQNIADESVRNVYEEELKEIIEDILSTCFVEIYQEDDTTIEMTEIKGYQLLDYMGSEMSFFHTQALYEGLFENRIELIEWFIDIPYILKIEMLFERYINIEEISLSEWKERAQSYINEAFAGDYVKRNEAKRYIEAMEQDWISRWIDS